MIGHSLIIDFKANGKKTTTATNHLQKAIVIGGIVSFKPLATIKLPDHIKIAKTANIYPILCRLLFWLFFNKRS